MISQMFPAGHAACMLKIRRKDFIACLQSESGGHHVHAFSRITRDGYVTCICPQECGGRCPNFFCHPPHGTPHLSDRVLLKFTHTSRDTIENEAWHRTEAAAVEVREAAWQKKFIANHGPEFRIAGFRDRGLETIKRVSCRTARGRQKSRCGQCRRKRFYESTSSHWC